MVSHTNGSGIISRPPNDLFAASEPHRAIMLRHQAWRLWMDALDTLEDHETLRLYHLSVASWTDANDMVAFIGLPTSNHPFPHPLGSGVSPAKADSNLNHNANNCHRHPEAEDLNALKHLINPKMLLLQSRQQ
jgi:hypothetical protein